MGMGFHKIYSEKPKFQEHHFFIHYQNREIKVHWKLSSSNQAAFKREKHKFGE
jgi:hypothetical protein